MNIEELTLGQIKQLQCVFNGQKTSDDCHWAVGENYFIRTVTHHFTGKLVKVTDKELVLEQACWIASDGRFADALAKSEFEEVEPFPEKAQVIVGRGGLIDAVRIDKIPKSQK